MATALCHEDLLFSGEQLKCQKKFTFSRGQYGSLESLQLGLWKGTKSEPEESVAVKRIKSNECLENWKDIIDDYVNGILSHTNVIRVVGFEDGIDDWRYFAIELSRATLEMYCTRQYEGPMPSDAQVLSQISSGIDYLHEKGYAHGQLNPHAILISQSHPVQMKVSDFGLYVGLITKGEQENEEDLTHPKYWTLYGSWSSTKENDSFRLINPTATVNGDVFAAGCILFYFLKRGLHLFGLDAKSILANITNNYPINLKRLHEGHFAFQSIKKMVGKPLNNGTQFLRVAAAHLRQVALKNDKRCGKEGYNASIFYGCSDQLYNCEHIQYAIRAGHVPVRGVNLGGWLVAENWINPKDPLWYGVPSEVSKGGEMHTIRYLGHEKGDARFQTHWNTFITEEDIATIARGSLNTVRVPIGWWILGYDNHDPPNRKEYKTFAPGGLYYLDRLVQEWAMKYNVAVLIDIHAAKGSQNGKGHSSPPDSEKLYWSQYPENIDNTIEVARFLAARYRYTPSFLGVELLNEPTSVDVTKLKDYYIRAYDAVRKTGNDCILVISSVLREQNAGNSSDWENFMLSPSYTNIWHDWHKDLLWGFENKTADWIMTEGVALIAADIAKWTGAPLIMGEWSLTSGSLGSGAKFTDVTLKQYANNMITAMNAMKIGWIMWTWKKEIRNPRLDGQGGWSMKNLINDRIMDPKLWDSSSTLCL